MTDFLYSRRTLDQDTLSAFGSSYFDITQSGPLFIRAGQWGSVIASASLYDGFDPYEDSQHVIVLAGAPFLEFEPQMRYDGANRHTRAILDHALANPRCAWHDALDGPCSFLIIDKRSASTRIVSDRMGYIPVFEGRRASDTTLGTKVTAVARLAEGEPELDPVSSAEFVLDGAVSFPHTLYQNTSQLGAGTDISMAAHSPTDLHQYYLPGEQPRFGTLDEAAAALRESLRSNVKKILGRSKSPALLMSGGEDSRTVLDAVPRNRKIQCITFTDTLNREAAIARRLAAHYEAPWQFVQRPPDHYLKDFHYCCQFIGNEVAVTQANFLGFPEEGALQSYDAVLGGLCSDFFLKGYAADLVHRTFRNYLVWTSSEERRTPDGIYHSAAERFAEFRNFVSPAVASQIIDRKMAHFRRVQECRPESAAEWRRVWPASQASESGQFNQNRRVFRTYEPFHMNGVLDVSVSVPLDWKINRRLFHQAFGRKLGRAAWIPHSDGWLPALSNRANVPVSIIVAAARWAVRRVSGGPEVNNASWPVWERLITHPTFYEIKREFEDEFAMIQDTFNHEYGLLFAAGGLAPLQQMRLLQVLFCVRESRS